MHKLNNFMRFPAFELAMLSDFHICILFINLYFLLNRFIIGKIRVDGFLIVF